MAEYSNDELLNEDGFKYKRKESLVHNYRAFQQAISFGRGVEFLSSSNEISGPVIYLFKIPGLSLHFDEAEQQLEKFNHDLLDHLLEIAGTKNDLFEIHKQYIDLYNAVHEQQQEYKLGKDQFFARVQIREFAVKDIKNLNLPILRSNYRGVFLHAIPTVPNPASFDEIGKDAKKCLSKFYNMKRKANMDLIKEMEKLKAEFFYKKGGPAHYRYKGDVADVLEIAMSLIETGKLEYLNRDTVIKPHDLFRDLCAFLNLRFSRLSNHIETIQARRIKQKLFLKQAMELLKKRLDKE